MLWAVVACLKSKAGDHDWMCSQNNIEMGAAELDPEPALEVKTGAINLVSRLLGRPIGSAPDNNQEFSQDSCAVLLQQRSAVSI